MPRDAQLLLQLLPHFGPDAKLRRRALETEIAGRLQQQQQSAETHPLQVEAQRLGNQATAQGTQIASQRDARAADFLAEQLATMQQGRQHRADLHPAQLQAAALANQQAVGQGQLQDLALNEAQFEQTLQPLRRQQGEAQLEATRAGIDAQKAAAFQALGLGLQAATPLPTAPGQAPSPDYRAALLQQFFPQIPFVVAIQQRAIQLGVPPQVVVDQLDLDPAMRDQLLALVQ